MKDDFQKSARIVVAFLLEDDAEGFFEYQVYPGESETRPGEVTYNIQVPEGRSIFVNKIWVPDPIDERGVKMVENRMRELAVSRNYPTGSFFSTPWGTYLIHHGNIGKMF